MQTVREVLNTAFGDVAVRSAMIGRPELRADNSGWALWEKVARNAKHVLGTDLNRQFRQGPWAVHLNGGPQASGEDWASIHIPINEMPLTELTEIMYTYYKFLAGTADVGAAPPNIVISVHDPNDHDARADINMTASASGAVTAGWHETIFDEDSTPVFWYGDGFTAGDVSEGTGTVHTWADFQACSVFRHFTVYRIQIDFGFWGSTRSAGDVWIGSIQINDIAVVMVPTDFTDLGTRKNLTGSPFGELTLTAAQNSTANWVRGAEDPLYQKGSTGWLANLYGGVQTDDDFAALFVPVNELPIPLFNTARWSYYMSAAQSAGVNMVLWVHDPYDHDIRAEITQKADTALLIRTAGWNAHELDPSVSQFYYYGENVANTSLITDVGPDNLFTWAQFQGDERFNTMTIYRISFEYGWWASGTFDDVYVADVVLNNEQIPLKPSLGSHIGQVGGYTVVVQDSFDRPADTTQYSIADALTDSTSAPTPLEWKVGRVAGGSGIIVSALLIMDSAVATKLDSHLWIFTTTLTPPNDNGACDLTDAEALTFVGMVDFGATPQAITNPTANAGGNCVYMQRALDIAFQCLPAEQNLYGFLVAQNTYMPLSGENFAVSLGVLQD